MRRVTLTFAVAACWVFCFVAPLQAQENAAATEDQYADEQGEQNAPGPDSECPGAKAVTTVTGDGNKQSAVFGITGDSFRITTSITGDPEFLFFSASVNKEGGGNVTTIDRESPGTDSSMVNAGPGNFFLDILAANTDYTITVEDCAGSQGGGGGGADVDNPNAVVPGSNSGKPLPNTGGPPYLAVGAMLLLGAAVVAGRRVLKP